MCERERERGKSSYEPWVDSAHNIAHVKEAELVESFIWLLLLPFMKESISRVVLSQKF